MSNYNKIDFMEELLFKSAKYGEISGVRIALSKKVNIHANDDWALCLAAKSGNKKIVELLLTFNMNVENRHNSPLKNAAENNHKEIVKLLLEHGADDTALAEHLQWKYADEILGVGTLAKMQGTEQPLITNKIKVKQKKHQQLRRYVNQNRLLRL